MATAALDQAATLAGALLSTFTLAVPEKRAPDVVTLAHARAAERVQQVASWFLRSSDLAVVTRRTPFLANDAKDLWDYYNALPLDQRPDLVLALLLAVELLESSRVLPRERFPKLRRALDVYAGLLGLSCCAPKKVYYHLHRGFWAIESSRARRETLEPITPMLLSSETGQELGRAADSALGMLRGQGLIGAPRSTGASGGSATAVWASVLLASSLGVGAVIWWLGADGVRRTRDSAVTRWSQLRSGAELALKTRLLQPPPAT